MVDDRDLVEAAQWADALDDAAEAVARAMTVRAAAAQGALSSWTGPHARTFRSRIDAEQNEASALGNGLREAADAVRAARARALDASAVAGDPR